MYIICNRIKGFWSVKRNSGTANENTNSQWSEQEACLHMQLRRGSLSLKTSESVLANEFDVRSDLHGQMSLAAVNQIYVIHEAMNGCKKKSKGSLKACFKNVNIPCMCLTLYLIGMAFNTFANRADQD